MNLLLKTGITQGVRLGKKLEIRVPSADALKTLGRLLVI